MKVFLATSISTQSASKRSYQNLVRYVTDTYPTFHYERDLSQAEAIGIDNYAKSSPDNWNI